MKGKALLLLAAFASVPAQAEVFDGLRSGLRAAAIGNAASVSKGSRRASALRNEWWYLTANLKGADGGRAMIIAKSAVGSF